MFFLEVLDSLLSDGYAFTRENSLLPFFFLARCASTATMACIVEAGKFFTKFHSLTFSFHLEMLDLVRSPFYFTLGVCDVRLTTREIREHSAAVPEPTQECAFLICTSDGPPI